MLDTVECVSCRGLIEDVDYAGPDGNLCAACLPGSDDPLGVPTAPPTFSEVEAMLVWERVDWDYFANGPEDSRWRILQTASKEWSIYRDGSLDGTTVTLRDAKFWVADTTFEELRPDIHQAREARRAERRARRLAGARS